MSTADNLLLKIIEEVALVHFSPCPNEAGPDTSSEYEDREGKVLDIIFQFRAEVILLAGVVHQDDLLHQLHRWPVYNWMDLGFQCNSPVNKEHSYSQFAFVTSKCYRSQECGPGLIVEDNDDGGSGQ